jgi:hypothetical protein
VESIWSGHLALHLCPRVNFPSRQQFSLEILLGLVEKIRELYVLLALVECDTTTSNFNLWMSKGVYDMFALVLNFLGNDW